MSGDSTIGHGPEASTDRRRFLGAASAVACAGLAGCLDGLSASGADGQSLADHPGAAGLADQPHRGPDPTEAAGTIVAFEDPSCQRCRAFERQTVPKIRRELVDPGDASFVFRGYPVVYPWGEPATQALESTFARDEAAFWALADHYFAEQSSFDEDNVLEKTESFLAAETSVDAGAVADDARAKRHDDAVQVDLAAGRDAEVSATPTVLLFRDGVYVTRASGSVSFDVVANALDL